jgi:pyruvate dehydrogenase E1 component alpha subunit
VLAEACDRARGGGGPTLIEAVTYRIGPHTNADDAARYRDQDEVERWLTWDPVDRMAAYMRACGHLDTQAEQQIDGECERYSGAMRDQLTQEPKVEPAEMFEHVYTVPTRQLLEQRAMVEAEENE